MTMIEMTALARTSVQAPPTPGETTVGDRSTEFVAVEGGQETTSAGGLLVAAYTIMWALVFLFVWFSWRRQRTLDARLDEIEAALRRRAGDAPEGA